jgi:hypothetical protein
MKHFFSFSDHDCRVPVDFDTALKVDPDLMDAVEFSVVESHTLARLVVVVLIKF